MPVTQQHIIFRKLLSVIMIGLLVLLTSMNFFVYGESNKNVAQVTAIHHTDSGEAGNTPENENSPTGPDEKSPGNPVTISEEYIHEQEEIASLFIDNLIHQLLLECNKIHPAHYELDTPPPDFIG